MEKLFERAIGSNLISVESEKKNIVTLVFENGVKVAIAGKIDSNGEPYLAGGSYKKD